jgi:hypothetical protein
MGAYKFNVCYDFRKSPPPAGLPKPTATQKTPWLAHLHPRLIGNIACEHLDNPKKKGMVCHLTVKQYKVKAVPMLK